MSEEIIHAEWTKLNAAMRGSPPERHLWGTALTTRLIIRSSFLPVCARILPENLMLRTLSRDLRASLLEPQVQELARKLGPDAAVTIGKLRGRSG